MFTRTIYTFTKLKQERERKRANAKSLGESCARVETVATGPAAVILTASAVTGTRSSSIS